MPSTQAMATYANVSDTSGNFQAGQKGYAYPGGSNPTVANWDFRGAEATYHQQNGTSLGFNSEVPRPWEAYQLPYQASSQMTYNTFQALETNNPKELPLISEGLSPSESKALETDHLVKSSGDQLTSLNPSQEEKEQIMDPDELDEMALQTRKKAHLMAKLRLVERTVRRGPEASTKPSVSRAETTAMDLSPRKTDGKLVGFYTYRPGISPSKPDHERASRSRSTSLIVQIPPSRCTTPELEK